MNFVILHTIFSQISEINFHLCFSCCDDTHWMVFFWLLTIYGWVASGNVLILLRNHSRPHTTFNRNNVQISLCFHFFLHKYASTFYFLPQRFFWITATWSVKHHVLKTAAGSWQFTMHKIRYQFNCLMPTIGQTKLR